ncbi:MAG: class I SAM-dependent methyltransferase [Paracoccus sp. (in: a-proteobacteria)]|nr:class I SAM-dependent methyltransferase [Paracoccus sp. (in: a-proteobacteria)]
MRAFYERIRNRLLRPAVSDQNAMPPATSLERARANKELRTRNEIAHFSKAYRMPMHTTKAKRNAYAMAQQIIQRRSIPKPVQFAVRAKELARDRSLRVLTVCCGRAATERMIFTDVAHRPRITLVDINQDLLNMAAENLASVADTTFICGDANEIKLPAGEFDVAMCVAGLHHIVELEHLIGQLAGCLKPDGEFWSIGEYAGRTGARLWPDSYEIADEIFAALPEKYRYNNIFRTHDEHLRNVDCSEATFEGIRADEIIEILGEHFESVHVDRWSTIAWRIIGPAYVDNYDLDDDEDRAIVERIANLDADYFLSGRLQPVGLKGIYRPRS